MTLLNVGWKSLRKEIFLRTHYTLRQNLEADGNQPVITVPKKVLAYKQKSEIKKAKKKPTRPHNSSVLISCRRPKFNHYQGQRYPEFKYEYLASHGWKHSRAKGDFFSIIGKSELNPSLASGMSFKELGDVVKFKKYLRDTNIVQPSAIQASSYSILRGGCNALCTAETGSGKTLAYLMPLFNRLFELKKTMPRSSFSPLCVILVPSRELVQQVTEVANDLSRNTGLIVHSALGEDFAAETDVIVSTPSALINRNKQGRCKLKSVLQLVLDEVDTLLDDSFYPAVRRILNKVQVQSTLPVEGQLINDGVQLVLTGATLPSNINNLLMEFVDPVSLERVNTSSEHCLLPHVTHRFLRVHPDQRPDNLVDELQKRDRRTLVFCNKSQTVHWLKSHLDKTDFTSLPLTGNLESQKRGDHLHMFNSGQCNLLVSTDIASRGIDTRSVERVINFEFPLYLSDYLHRAGRVGRLQSAQPKRKPEVFSLVSYKWDVELLWLLETSVRLNQPLRQVNANIKGALRQRRQQNSDADR